MPQTIIPVAAFALIMLIGVATLRAFPKRVRLAFDGLCFACISLYFVSERFFPIFPPLDDHADVRAASLRVVGGAWWLFGARLFVAALWTLIYRDRRSREARLFSDLSAAGVYLAVGLVILSSVFALPVTGVVATSGVVAIVLGLALQNTLADVFAGIAVGIENPFHIGDRVQINDKLEGVVVQANWRSIRIQTDADDIAIIPNSIIAKAEIINRSLPSPRRTASAEISCPDRAPPEQVIECLLNATLLCPDILASPAATAVLSKLGPVRHTYTVTFHVRTAKDLAATKSLLLRMARRQLRYAGLLSTRRAEGRRPYEGAPFSLLRDAILFESLSNDQISQLARDLRPRRLAPDEALFTNGQIDHTLYLIESGVIELSRTSNGAAEVLGSLGAGEYVGEIGLLTGAPHGGTAAARTHCVVHLLPHEALAPVMAGSPELAAALEESARKGLELLHREVAARAAPNIGNPGQLLTRIRSFFETA